MLNKGNKYEFMKNTELKQFRNTRYYVSHNGEIFAKYPPYRKIPERFKKRRPVKLNSGYLKLGLTSPEEKEAKTYLVHVIVCEVFHGPRPEKKVVNHINGVKTDNRPENLEWVTRQENQLHAIKLGLQKNNPPPRKKLTVSQVQEIRRNPYLSYRYYADKFCVSRSTIKAIRKRISWKQVF